ncbi:hypothetical protein HYN56_09020 [Flavobacterium crocinum]|uniref:Squalene cyclase C-terminal domain-containing protein n=1 Tax=Flavobacterium crocinum TaxID=2183896 RepID=A0A2S1YJW6_9FLAO|nr:prenyltransferase/squalene oxidase repeat-containing protein [Flavobacterium crocinum]AWK04370.1 hypothetical protein HYN56_09020 [Flavobacterium crocinum]
MKFKSYIEKLDLLHSFKSQILEEDFINKNPVYYQNYPSLFSKSFSIATDDLELLDIAGYLYYQATIFTDLLIDEGDFSKFPLIGICQEESIKILTSIYGLESDFWRYWNLRRNEYLQAVYLEKSFLQRENMRIEEYEELADKKSAFGKVAIDCLHNLDSENNKVYQKLLLSHKYFSTAFQLNDDIQDFKRDLKKGQFNWANYLLKKQNIDSQNPEVLEKYLYIRGISRDIYGLGISYCDKALKLVENIIVPDWIKVLNDTKKRFVMAIKEIDNYLEILTAEINLSDVKKEKNDVQCAISNSIEFIKKRQNEDGSWREYVNQGGISNIWATAFLTAKISENSYLKIVFENEILKSLKFFIENTKNNLWSYNSTWIEDADSTNFALLSLLQNNVEIDVNIISHLIKYQNETGGFSTYNDKKYLIQSLEDNNITDVSGWTSSHNCVSAVSFYFLALYNQKSTSFLNLRNYFEIDFEKKTDSYWWTSSLYTLNYLAKTYYHLEEFEKLNWIIMETEKLQNDNGSFGDKYGESKFYTALGIEILLLGSSSKLKTQKGISYLLENQFDDGSWENSNALQVPNSKSLKPDELMYPISSFGMNVRAKEFNRLFTTISVLQTLSKYERRYNS